MTPSPFYSSKDMSIKNHVSLGLGLVYVCVKALISPLEPGFLNLFSLGPLLDRLSLTQGPRLEHTVTVLLSYEDQPGIDL